MALNKFINTTLALVKVHCLPCPNADRVMNSNTIHIDTDSRMHLRIKHYDFVTGFMEHSCLYMVRMICWDKSIYWLTLKIHENCSMVTVDQRMMSKCIDNNANRVLVVSGLVCT